MTSQAELFRSKPSPATAQDVADFIEWLDARPGWHKAAEIGSAFKVSDRTVRQYAEASAGKVVSSPGSPGYQHVRHCSKAERDHAIGQLRSQAGNMRQRAQQIELAARTI